MIITGISIVAFFYLVYFGKMLLQKRKGIQNDHIAKGTKRDLTFYIELVLKCATYAVPVVELISIFVVEDYLPMPVIVLGAILGILGDLIFVTAVFTMRDSWRAGIAKEEKTKMITGGIYKYSRNPAFLGFDLVYIGILLMFFNWFLFGFTLFAMLMLHIQILQEEKHLAKVFGDEYLRYKKRVNRYLGWKSWQINDSPEVRKIIERPIEDEEDEMFLKQVEPAKEQPAAVVKPVAPAEEKPVAMPLPEPAKEQPIQVQKAVSTEEKSAVTQSAEPVSTQQEAAPSEPEQGAGQAEVKESAVVSRVDFTVNEMLSMQETLQKKYNENWEPIGPDTGRHKLLWMIGEVGEVIDIVKKNGGQKACGDNGIRKELVEELADVLMYYNDVLLCYGISAEELKQVYTEKFKKNMERW